MKQDLQISELIKKEESRQLHGIELIASENFVSDNVLAALGSCLTNKYAEGYPGARYYGGCEVVDQVEQLAIDRLKELYGAEFANVQPHSGAQANMAVFMACLKPGDTFMGLDLAHGGHLTHGSPVNMSGINYHPVAYKLNEETGRVDYDQMEKTALECKPKLIVGGASAYSREWDWKRMREIADEVGAIFMVDMAHPHGPSCRTYRCRPAGQSCQVCPYCHHYYPQDPTRSPWRSYYHRQGLRESLGTQDS